MFLERAIHAFIWSQGFSNHVLICVYYSGSLVFRTSHSYITLRAEALRSSWISPDLSRKIEGPLLAGYTCIYQFPTFPTTFLYAFSNRVACLFAFIVSARVFLEQTIMTCLVPFPPQLLQTAISIRVFLERAMHAFFRSVSNCDFICAYYFGSRVERVVWTY